MVKTNIYLFIFIYFFAIYTIKGQNCYYKIDFEGEFNLEKTNVLIENESIFISLLNRLVFREM